MEKRRFDFGRLPIAVVGQGTWYLERATRADALATLRRGLDLGMNHIDTAELYGWGRVEELVAEAIAERRDEVFLVSKVHPRNAARAKVIDSCEATLRRLRTDHLDVYLLHWRSAAPLAETMEAFQQLERAGKIRAFGVSNFDAADLDEALAIVGPGRLACNQVLYHLEERSIEHQVIPWCKRHGVAVTAYSPFAVGRFPSPRSPGGQVLAAIAAAHGATPHQVALRFLVRDPAVLAIPKSTRAEHARDNAAAGDLVLTADELRRIDEAFPLGPAPRELPML
jgi:diketogulonate reductase-like aldo/keto reductase